MEKPPFELESLQAAVFRHDRNIAALQRAVHDEEMDKKGTDNQDIQDGCMANIEIFGAGIREEETQKADVKFYIEQHERYIKYCKQNELDI